MKVDVHPEFENGAPAWRGDNPSLIDSGMVWRILADAGRLFGALGTYT
ncbi:MAG TPA: hypothetical protein VNT00_10880 [Eoetvoesiella sp.]|nr:hypothetical protein [Eoetvoesiella sp.]HWK61916.1 hypothetical protein [Eoetvoesiella sp.]